MASLQDALAALEGGGYAGAVVDLTLPRYAGLEVVERLAPVLRAAGVPCIALTESDEQAIQLFRRAFIRAGASTILSKPASGLQLVAALEEAIERRNQEERRGPALVAASVANVGRAVAADIAQLRAGIAADLEALRAELAGAFAEMAAAYRGLPTEAIEAPISGGNSEHIEAEVATTTSASAHSGGWIVAMGETWVSLKSAGSQRSALGAILAILAGVGSIVATCSGVPFIRAEVPAIVNTAPSMVEEEGEPSRPPELLTEP